MKKMILSVRMASVLPPVIALAWILFGALPASAQSAPAQDTWTGADTANSTNWTDAANWQAGTTPLPYDSLTFSGSAVANSNGFPNGTAFDGITFAGGASGFNLTGNSILLSGQSAGNFNGVSNSSGIPQAVVLNLNLDWGYYTFSSPSGGSLALNGGLALHAGAAAYFDANNTSSTLVNDTENGGPGLISGLGGAGLIYNTGAGLASPFIGLAAMSGTTITTYGFAAPGGTTVASAGAIGSTTASGAQNVELTANATGNYTLNGGTGSTYFNTIYLNNASGSSTLTVGSATGNQTIVLGANNASGIGGFYVQPVNNASSAKTLEIGSGASTILTAGTTSAGGVIVLGANGSTSGTLLSSANPGYNLQLNASPANNSAGGPVSLVILGNGLTRFTTLSSYANINFSGGTYVLQGVYTAGNSNDFGTGPVYVASGATLYLNNAGTYTNPMYLCSGQGYSYNSSDLEPGVFYGALTLNAAVTFAGPVTLLGSPTAYSQSSGPTSPNPGSRISNLDSGVGNSTISGQITGTGTLEMNGAHSWTLQLDNPVTSGPGTNNWQGGVILDALATHAINLELKMLANNKLAGGNVTLVAPIATSGDYARFDLNATAQTIGALIGAGSFEQNNVVGNYAGSGAATLTLGAINASGIFSGATSDSTASPLGFIKIGSGSQTFDNSGGGTFLYHGNTTISNGTLALTGSVTIPNTPVITVASAGTLDASAVGGLTLGAAQTLNCVGTVLGNTTINGTVEALDSIGTLTVGNGANLIFGSGGTYVWNINNATGTAGKDPGWSMINVSGQLQLGSLSAGSFTISIASLNTNDATGSASNFNTGHGYSFPIAYAAGGISGFSSGQFKVVTTSFANYPAGASQWSVSVDNTGDYLMLNFNGFAAITTPLPLAPLVVNQDGTATFTVTANSLGTSPSFTWYQNGNPLSNGGQSAGGAPGNVSIVTTGGGYTSTLTLSGVDSVQDADSGVISVTASETYNSVQQTGSSSETLTVIDAPYNPNVTPSQTTPPITTGSVNILSASASGTQPFTYQWYLNGNAISGATGSNFIVNVSPGTLGSYTVVISNPAGSTNSSPVVITGPVSVVPNQILFEPFNYQGQGHPASPPGFWTAVGVTNNFNQATGAAVAWQNVGVNDFTTDPDGTFAAVDPYTAPPYGVGTRPIVNDEYPVSGLAGNDGNDIYADSDLNGGQVNLPLGSAITSGEVYGSFVVQLWGLDPNAGSADDYLCGFGAGASNSTTHSFGLFIQPVMPPLTFPNAQYQLGIFKGNLTPAQASPGVNGNWDPAILLDYNVDFVVCRLNINAAGPGFSTCDMWINPSSTSFYASEVNVPTPDVAGVGGGVADVAGGVSLFFMKITTYPVDRYFSDVRIGTTWASVTPPSAPRLALANQILTNPASSTVVFASQNAGNPVSGNYQWYFNNGATPLSDGPNPTGDGSVISNSATSEMTIIGATAADQGAYTVTGSNTDPSPGANGTTLTGSASALLTTNPPALAISNSPPNVILSWPTNWAVGLEVTTNLAAPASWTPVSGGESSFLYWPPGSGSLAEAPVSPITISGPDYTVSVNPGNTNALFFRLAPSP